MCIRDRSGTNPEFLARLKELDKKLSEGVDKEANKELLPYARFSLMTAEYIKEQNNPKGEFVAVQTKWLEDLRSFVKAFPAAPESGDALLHLAIDAEYSGKEDEAKKLYGLIVTQFPQSVTAKK